MIKLRKYSRGYTRIFVHGTVENREVKLRGELNRPEWISEDIDLLKPVSLKRNEWKNIHTGEYIGCSLFLEEIVGDKLEITPWYDGCVISSRTSITEEPKPGTDVNNGPFFCLFIDGKEYWYDDILENLSEVQACISNYNTELYLKAIDD